MFSRCHAVPPRLALGVLGVGSVTSPPLQPHVCMGIFVHGEIFFFPPEKCQCLLVAICQPLQIATVPGSAQVCPEARYGPVLALLCKAWSSRFSIGNAQVSVWVASSKNQRVFCVLGPHFRMRALPQPSVAGTGGAGMAASSPTPWLCSEHNSLWEASALFSRSSSSPQQGG